MSCSNLKLLRTLGERVSGSSWKLFNRLRVYLFGPRFIGYGCQRSRVALGKTVGFTQLIGQRPLRTSPTSLPVLRRVSGRIRVVAEAT